MIFLVIGVGPVFLSDLRLLISGLCHLISLFARASTSGAIVRSICLAVSDFNGLWELPPARTRLAL